MFIFKQRQPKTLHRYVVAADQVRDDFATVSGAYRKALKAFRNGERQVLFPEGTWLMKVRFRVRTKATGVP